MAPVCYDFLTGYFPAGQKIFGSGICKRNVSCGRDGADSPERQSGMEAGGGSAPTRGGEPANAIADTAPA